MHEFPEKYDRAEYVSWHEAVFPQDKDLEARIAAHRDNLKAQFLKNHGEINALLAALIGRSAGECFVQSNGLDSGDYQPDKGLTSKTGPDFDLLFKGVGPILEKMWRKNKNGPLVEMSNLDINITDLVRSSVVCSSQFSARIMADRLKHIEKLIPEVLTKDCKGFKSIHVDDEAKAQSGYFAFHADLVWDGLPHFELQIFSQLSKAWRDISHHLYEKTRVGGMVNAQLGGPESIFISLGHLLHIADTQHESLITELKELLK